MKLSSPDVSLAPGPLSALSPLLSPSKKSPHGPALRAYHGYPHLLGSDPRRGTLFGGYGEVSVSRIIFALEDHCAPFGDPFARPVADDAVLCAVSKDAAPVLNLLLPHSLQSQTNLTFTVAVDGALGDALATQLTALGLKVERCTAADLFFSAVLASAPSTPSDYGNPPNPPDEPPPPAAVAVKADTMPRQVFDEERIRFDVEELEAALLAEAEATPVIDDTAPHPDQHAPSPPAVAAPAEGVAAAVDDVARPIPDNEEAREEEGENIRGARAARMDADQDASTSHDARQDCEPQLELSVGCGRLLLEEDGTIQRDENGREKPPIGLGKVKPWTGTPRELHAFLDSHRYRSTNKSFKHKVGHFIVGAVFAGTEKHPTGHRHSNSLQRATLVLFDIDNAHDLTRAKLEARLRSLGVGFIFYSTWSNARAGSGKTGLCARIVFWLTRPLTALPAHSIGQQLASIVRHLSACLEIDSTKAVDEVSKRPDQLMYTPRGHDAGHSGPDEWWCELHNGPSLNPDALPGGVSLADLLAPIPPAQQLADSDPPTAHSDPTPPPSSTFKTSAPKHRRGSDDASHARGLAYIETCAEDLKRFGSGRYERITQHVGPRCGSIAAGHGLTEAEGLEPLETVVNAWGRDDLTKALRATFTHGYRDRRTLPDNSPPRPAPKSNTKTATPAAQLDTAPTTHTEATSTAPRRVPFIVGNPAHGTIFALPDRFDLICRKYPDPQKRPHLACVDSVEDIDSLASLIPDGKRVFIAIHPTHDLYPHALETFRAKNCDVRHLGALFYE